MPLCALRRSYVCAGAGLLGVNVNTDPHLQGLVNHVGVYVFLSGIRFLFHRQKAPYSLAKIATRGVRAAASSQNEAEESD